MDRVTNPWPELHLIRHGQSEYNILKAKKDKDPLYQKFKRKYEEWDRRIKNARIWILEKPGAELEDLAIQVMEKYSLTCSDADTELTEEGKIQAQITGRELDKFIIRPDVIFCSDYKRTNQTMENVLEFCPQLQGVKIYQEERIREQEHGLMTLYNDWRVYHVFNPQYKEFANRSGSNNNRFDCGENRPAVRDRVRSWFDKLIREYSGKRVYAFSHHLTILTIVGLHKHWTKAQFNWWDKYRVPPNTSVTTLIPNNKGKLILDQYGKVYY